MTDYFENSGDQTPTARLSLLTYPEEDGAVVEDEIDSWRKKREREREREQVGSIRVVLFL